MGLRKSGTNALIRLTAPDGSYIDLSGVALDGRSRANNFAFEIGANVLEAVGYNEDWVEHVPAGSSFWKAAVSVFYNAAADEVEEFLNAMHVAQHAVADCADAGVYTLRIMPEGDCEGVTDWRGEHAVLLTRTVHALPHELLMIEAAFGGWIFRQEDAEVGMLVATTASGLYYAQSFTFDDSDPTWSPLGQALPISQISYDKSAPAARQVCRSGGSVWLRRPAVSGDNWIQILTGAEAQSLIGDADNGEFTWAEYNTVKQHIYALWNYSLTAGGIWFLKSTDWGASWTAVNVYSNIFNYEGGNIAVGLQTGNVVYVTAQTESGGKGTVWVSEDAGDSFTLAYRDYGGGWTPYLFVDPADEDTAYLGIHLGVFEEYELWKCTLPGFSCTEIDGDLHAGTLLIGFSSAGWISPEDSQIIRTTRNGALFAGDAGVITARRELNVFEVRALAGWHPHDLVYGTYIEAAVDNPHLVFATPDDGVTIYNKGGANANQADGGGDSIPYTARRVSQNGIAIIES
jgi:hypothetical protein